MYIVIPKSDSPLCWWMVQWKVNRTCGATEDEWKITISDWTLSNVSKTRQSAVPKHWLLKQSSIFFSKQYVYIIVCVAHVNRHHVVIYWDRCCSLFLIGSEIMLIWLSTDLTSEWDFLRHSWPVWRCTNLLPILYFKYHEASNTIT